MNDETELDQDDLDEPDAEEEEREEGDDAGGRDAGPFLAGLVVGAAVGAGFALLFAPAPGRTTRRRLRRKAEALESEMTDRLEKAATAARKEYAGRRADLRERIERGIERMEDRDR